MVRTKEKETQGEMTKEQRVEHYYRMWQSVRTPELMASLVDAFKDTWKHLEKAKNDNPFNRT